MFSPSLPKKLNSLLPRLCVLALFAQNSYTLLISAGAPQDTSSSTATTATINSGLFKTVYAPALSGTRLANSVTVSAMPPSMVNSAENISSQLHRSL